MGISRSERKRREEYILEHFDGESLQELAEHTGYSVSGCDKVVNRLGLRQNRRENKYKSINEHLDEDDNWYYFFGLVMADGSYRKDNRVELQLVEYDVELLEKLAVWLEYKPKIGYYKNCKTTRKRAVLGFTSEIYNEKFERMGLEHNKQARESYRNIPDQYFIDFFRGYFDGDGNVSDGRIRVYSGWDIINQFREDIHRMYGLVGRVESVSTSDKVGGLIYNVIESKKLTYEMYNHGGIYLDRKKTRLFDWYRWNDISEVTEENFTYGRRRINGERGNTRYS